ncbi:MAG: ribonuclease P protein component, partial [Muribaculaceae bacterium]|nr:ribonuclease P protein component [Muribaculaceae bacterium]
MSSNTLRLYKSEKLCSQIAIDALFSRRVTAIGGEPQAALAYPLRLVWRCNRERQSGHTWQFLISVPKKRLRHAVDRVTMRRRVREAYRLHRDAFPDITDDAKYDLAFIYLASKPEPSAAV